MPRLMSVALTTQAVVERRKTVTRRLGWKFLKPGDRLTLCRKVQGRKAGEPIDRLAEVEVVSVQRERLAEITYDDMVREGVPLVFLSPFLDGTGSTLAAWVAWFGHHMKLEPYDYVTRIEWRYLDEVSA